jgi:anaerobic dimethyl sulfoxide reductase subunit B (iron-sulfur subunit)
VQIGFYCDMNICTGCKTCQIACKDKNNLEAGILFRRVHTVEGGKFPHPWVYCLSVSCNHCEEPDCVKNCPMGAMYKREKDGIVMHDTEKCIGCKICVSSCPYGAPQLIEKEGKAAKCDFCADIIDRGEDPACVASCPMRALHYGDVEELRRKYGDAVDANMGTTAITFIPKNNMT